MSSSAASPEAPWRAGFRSARANLVPGLVLQLVALTLVTAYYQHAPTRITLDRLAAWRDEIGIPFAILSTALFGGLLPALVLSKQRSGVGHFTLGQAAAITAFWAYKGWEVDLLYRLLARFLGAGHDVGTVVAKVAFDQFVYCPVLAVPVTVLVYGWVEARFDGGVLLADLRAGGWFRRRVLPLLVSSLWVWLPTVAIIYTLPTPLQLPLQNLVLCFFTLLVAHQSRDRSEALRSFPA